MKVKNEPICNSQSISQSKKENKVKEEPIDIELKNFNFQIEVKSEDKFSATKEFADKTSIQTISIS